MHQMALHLAVLFGDKARAFSAPWANQTNLMFRSRSLSLLCGPLRISR